VVKRLVLLIGSVLVGLGAVAGPAFADNPADAPANTEFGAVVSGLAKSEHPFGQNVCKPEATSEPGAEAAVALYFLGLTPPGGP
jgi:hypothetical protein